MSRSDEIKELRDLLETGCPKCLFDEAEGGIIAHCGMCQLRVTQLAYSLLIGQRLLIEPPLDELPPVTAEILEKRLLLDMLQDGINRQPTRLERIVCALAQGQLRSDASTVVDYAHQLMRAIEIRESDPDFNKHG